MLLHVMGGAQISFFLSGVRLGHGANTWVTLWLAFRVCTVGMPWNTKTLLGKRLRWAHLDPAPGVRNLPERVCVA